MFRSKNWSFFLFNFACICIVCRLPFSPISHPFLKAIRIKSQVRIEKVHFVNLSVSPAREAHFEESELSKTIQNILENLSRNPPEKAKKNDQKYLKIRTYKSTKNLQKLFKNLPKNRPNIQAFLSVICKPQGRVRSGARRTRPPPDPPLGGYASLWSTSLAQALFPLSCAKWPCNPASKARKARKQSKAILGSLYDPFFNIKGGAPGG